MSERIGVLGAGVMGSGIAQVMAIAGHDVTCYDIAEAALEKGRSVVESGRFGIRSAVDKGRLTAEEGEIALERIEFTTDLDAAATTDVVIEAVPEQLDLKIRVFADLDRRAPSGTILASNSSGFPIAALAAATQRPDRVVGWHWASPVPVMKLAEIVRTPDTSDETVATISRLAAGAGKNPIVIKDTTRFWGYVANRIYGAMRREAERVVDEGIASPEEVDQLLIDCYRWPVGPFSLGRGTRSGWG